MAGHPTYSVVVPVFNSEPSLKELFSGIKEVFERIGAEFEVIFVEDSSVDRSWEVIRELKAAWPEIITGIRLSKNYGQHNATLCGFSFAKGERIITIDDDLQVPPGEIARLIDCYDKTGADLVYGTFKHKRHSAVRNLGSYSVKKSSKYLRKSPGEGSSFRLIKAELVKRIAGHNQYFLFIDEILLWYTSDVAWTGVTHLPRKYRESNYSLKMLLKIISNGLLFYTMIPLKFLIYGGFIASAFFLLLGVHFIYRKLFLGVPVSGYTSLIVAILFSTGIILFSLGVIGEYISRIYSVQSRKPPYSVKKVI